MSVENTEQNVIEKHENLKSLAERTMTRHGLVKKTTYISKEIKQNKSTILYVNAIYL